ncbi:MAG TPA: A24 family peptidase [Rhodocyclaceae bacterium]|jgi:prepilin peptidase CpaA|nr:prepilin peptidase [Rhodocyclaceae bacterium]HNB78682.1 A24 family peptidase [Rhodocyclaceae bacterium]HNH13761.1 A24 family peptidase [Rhodocyclaceae bacterium]HNH98678.1 A24 family peptidase [Rhodocyclaceae bacterium]
MNTFAQCYLSGLCVLSLAVALSDYRRHRIPNLYLLIALVYGLGVSAFFAWQLGLRFALGNLGFSLFGMFIGWFLLFFPYRARQVAAGDVKFMMVIGFFLGPIGTVFALLNGALVGGLWALVLSWRHGGLASVFRNIGLMWRTGWLSGFKEVGWDLRSAGAVRMPYGVALAAGVWMVAAWQIARSPAVRAWAGY